MLKDNLLFEPIYVCIHWMVTKFVKYYPVFKLDAIKQGFNCITDNEHSV